MLDQTAKVEDVRDKFEAVKTAAIETVAKRVDLPRTMEKAARKKKGELPVENSR